MDSNCVESSSNTGPIIRQGPHHVAVKSTTMVLSAFWLWCESHSALLQAGGGGKEAAVRSPQIG